MYIREIICKFIKQNPENDFDTFYARFLKSDLGKIYQSIPWEEMIKTMKIKTYRKGPKSIFSSKRKIALMFLKHWEYPIGNL